MDLLSKVLDFYTTNRDAIELVFAIIVYILVHRTAAFSHAKGKAGELIIAAEKGAEQLLLNSGSEKMDWVVQKAYQKMPASVRVVISFDVFRNIAQGLINKAKQTIATQPTPTANPAAPVVLVADPVPVPVPATPAVTPTIPEVATQIKVDEKP